MMVGPNQPGDYASASPLTSERQSGLGIASAVTATLELVLAVTCRIDILESLAFQFYAYAILFFASATLGFCSLTDRKHRRAAAWVGIGMSILGAGFKLSTLYVLMRSCAAKGWMSMPWPLR